MSPGQELKVLARQGQLDGLHSRSFSRMNLFSWLSDLWVSETLCAVVAQGWLDQRMLIHSSKAHKRQTDEAGRKMYILRATSIQTSFLSLETPLPGEAELTP